MLFQKINNRISTERKNDFLSWINYIVIAMHLCKHCFFLNIQCVMRDASKKCVACVNSKKSYDLVISFAKLRRIHKERIRLRNEIWAMRAKSNRLKEQLLRTENEEKQMMFREWDIINSLKKKKQQQKNVLFNFLWDVFFEQFQLFNNLNWSSLIADSIDFSFNEIIEETFCSSSDFWMILTCCLNVNILFIWWDTTDSFFLEFFLSCIFLLRLIQNETLFV